MATYAIGDIQGCYKELINLLDKINFNSENDTLWFVGDLVNRGDDSLSVLRFVKNLGDKHIVVLGNHDMHLLATAYGFRKSNGMDTFSDVLESKDRDELLTWLRSRKFLHYDHKLNFVLTHAGIYPQWDLPFAEERAKEIENILRGENYFELLKNQYGNHPNNWSDDLKGHDRYRFIVNAFTRMRYCDKSGGLNLTEDGPISKAPKDLIPWFKFPNRKCTDVKIVFGHWAALNGTTDEKNVFAIDTGCVWGNKLTALELETGKRFEVEKLKNDMY